MAWYGDGGWSFRPCVSVAEKKARAAKAIARIAKKRGRPAEPVLIQRRGRGIATTFWGKAWCDNLERYMDFANRLPRGRTYVRNGSVVDLAIARGTVEARVAGSGLYTVTVHLTSGRGRGKAQSETGGTRRSTPPARSRRPTPRRDRT